MYVNNTNKGIGKMKIKIKDKEIKNRIDSAVESLFSELETGKSERLLKYLDFAARFRHYSFYNTLLIYFQNPEASYVTGYITWNEQGFIINKGSKAIKILAPRFYKCYKKDDETIFINKDNKIPDDVEIEEGIYFIPVSVFDISQTTKTEKAKDIITDYYYSIGNDFKNEYLKLKDKIENEGIKIIENNNGRPEGTATADKITIKSSRDYNNRFLTLLHEYTHVLADHTNGDFTKQDKEVQAEAVSYMVAKSLGLENPFSKDYILHWGKDKKTFTKNLEKVLELTNKIMEKF